MKSALPPIDPWASASRLAAALQRGDIGSRELLETWLERVDRLNPALNAIVTLDTARARAAADNADRSLRQSGPTGPLHGLPMTVKDSFETAGLRTTSGSPELASHVPERDATAVARLKAAGAIVFGKTNLPVFAADVQTFNPLFGITRNPWDLARSPGGSSGGAAAALAAGLTPLELGSDIGGSIRNPAHYCGVHGHKPSHGLVPGRGHIPGPPGTLSTVDLGVFGPMARHAEDLALGLQVLAGPDDAQAVAWRLQWPPPRARRLQDFRVAAWLDDPASPVDGRVREVLESLVERLRRAGVRVDTQARPAVSFDEALTLYYSLLFGGTSARFPDGEFDEMRRDAASLSPDDRSLDARWLRDSVQTHRSWLHTHERRERLRAEWARFFGDHDVLLTPVTPVTAILHDTSEPEDDRVIEVDDRPLPYWNQIDWSALAGAPLLPATVAPAGLSADGLPVGVQIIGPGLEDPTTIAFALALEGLTGGFRPPPWG